MGKPELKTKTIRYFGVEEVNNGRQHVGGVEFKIPKTNFRVVLGSSYGMKQCVDKADEKQFLKTERIMLRSSRTARKIRAAFII